MKIPIIWHSVIFLEENAVIDYAECNRDKAKQPKSRGIVCNRVASHRPFVEHDRSHETMAFSPFPAVLPVHPKPLSPEDIPLGLQSPLGSDRRPRGASHPKVLG